MSENGKKTVLICARFIPLISLVIRLLSLAVPNGITQIICPENIVTLLENRSDHAKQTLTQMLPARRSQIRFIAIITVFACIWLVYPDLLVLIDRKLMLSNTSAFQSIITTKKPPRTPKLYKMLNWEQRESEKRLNHIDDLIRTAPRYNLSTCVVQKSMSTVMTSMFCYLRDEKKFLGANRDILKDWKIVRFCMFQNEFRNIGGIFKKFKVNPKNNTWTHIMMVRDPVERLVSGFVDKCYRKPVVRHFCNNCGRNLTCFMETELERMRKQVDENKFLRTYEDRHFFPQNWRCNLHEYFSHFTFIPYSSSSNYSVTSHLFPIFRSHGVPETSLAHIESSLSSGRTAHSTVSSKATAFIEKRLKSSPYLMEILVKMFYHDFVLFNFTLPAI